MMATIGFPGAGGGTLSVVEMQTAQKARKAVSVRQWVALGRWASRIEKQRCYGGDWGL